MVWMWIPSSKTGTHDGCVIVLCLHSNVVGLTNVFSRLDLIRSTWETLFYIVENEMHCTENVDYCMSLWFGLPVLNLKHTGRLCVWACCVHRVLPLYCMSHRSLVYASPSRRPRSYAVDAEPSGDATLHRDSRNTISNIFIPMFCRQSAPLICK